MTALRSKAYAHEPQAAAPGRLVLASHRLPIDAKGATASGLVSGLLDGIGSNSALWFGCCREPLLPVPAPARALGDLTLQPVPIDAALYDRHYNGFSNAVLWPAFHGMPERVRRSAADYESYHAVNRQFAAAMCGQVAATDRIWVHDYQLMPLGYYLRQAGETARLGFFLHIPVPRSGDLIRTPCLELLRTLDAYDVVGVQTAGDAARLRAIQPRLKPRIVVAPVGINAEKIQAEAAANCLKQHLPERTGDRLIVGVDRLDYTKGLCERLDGFHRLLDDHKRYRGEVTLLQVVAPNRRGIVDYEALLHCIRKRTKTINLRWRTKKWTPITLIEKSIPRSEIAGLLRRADVGLVTPLCDGMNLLAKEFVAAQKVDSPGSLVLSRQAGAAETLGAAQLVDASSASDVAQGIHRALSMSLQQRRNDHQKMRLSVDTQSADAWCKSFLAALNAARVPTSMENYPSPVSKPGRPGIDSRGHEIRHRGYP